MIGALLLAPLLSVATVVDKTACSVVQSIELPGVASAVVRAEQNTKDGPANSMDPICARCSAGDSSSDPDTCDAEEGALRVPFNTRSYLLSQHDASSCPSAGFGGHDYECVDYGAGATYLSGRELAFDIDLSGAGCVRRALPVSQPAHVCA
jgi:hypothetical protein